MSGEDVEDAAAPSELMAPVDLGDFFETGLPQGRFELRGIVLGSNLEAKIGGSEVGGRRSGMGERIGGSENGARCPIHPREALEGREAFGIALGVGEFDLEILRRRVGESDCFHLPAGQLSDQTFAMSGGTTENPEARGCPGPRQEGDKERVGGGVDRAQDQGRILLNSFQERG